MNAEKKTLTQLVYDKVYADIVNAQMSCNEIITEARLAEQMQVSKAPVREALLMLCQENILQSVPRMGYFVTHISPAQVGKLVEARILLETNMLEMGWANIGQEQIQELHDLHHRLRKDTAETTIMERWNANMEFHLMLAGYCGNEYLINSLRQMLRTSARAATQCFLGYREKGHEASYHDMILDALRMPSFEKAREALISDIRELM